MRATSVTILQYPMKQNSNPRKRKRKGSGNIAGEAIGKQARSCAEADVLAGQHHHGEEFLKDPGGLEVRPGQESEPVVPELGTYQIELEMQNEELRAAQQELEESRRLLADLYDFSPVGYFSLDPDGKIISVNLTGAAMLGSNKNELSRKAFSLLVHKEDADIFYFFLRRARGEDDRQVTECRLQKKDGTLLPVQLEGITIRDEVGDVVEMRISVSDISQRIVAENKLQRKSSLLRAIIDSTDVMLVYLDPDFNFLWVNPSYARTCNMTPEELAGKNHFVLFPHKENEEIFQRVRDSGQPVFFKDKPFEFPDQPERGVTYWDWSLVPVKDPADRVTALVFTLRETTKYKQAELELAESEERFRRMAETSTDIIFQLDSCGRFTYVSPAVRALGYSPDQVQGRPLFRFIPPAELRMANQALSRINRGQEISLLALRVRKADGSTALCEISATPIARDGKVAGVQGIARDITERQRTEEILRISEAQLRTTLHTLAEGVIVSDFDGNLVYWNPAAVSIHGFSSEREYLRRLPEFAANFELATVEEGILPYERWPLNRILQGETLRACEVHIRRLDIDWARIFRYSGTQARDKDGKPLLAVLALADITERKLAEKKIRRNNALLQGIKEIFEAGLACETDEDLAAVTLRVAEKLTGSRFGLIGEIGPDGLLHDIAVWDPGWQQWAMEDKTGPRRPPGSFRIEGLHGQVLAEGVPFFTNDPSSHPANIGTPAGHPPLTSFLGVPLAYGGKTIGMVALANRDGGYGDDDLESVQALAAVFVETLRKSRTERALRESEARERSNALQFKQLLDFTPVPIWIAHDPECRVITGNLAAARLLGVDPAGNVSQSPPGEEKVTQLRVFRNGEELTPEEMPLHHAVAHGIRADDIEIDIITSSGNARRMLGSAAPLYDAERKVRGGIAALMDITERKSIEKQLLQAKQEWEMTFDAVPDLIAIIDPQHRIVRANRAMADKMRIRPDQCIGALFACVHKSSHPNEECPHVLTRKDGRQHMAEVHEKSLGGDFLVTTTPLVDGRGEIFATVHVARDVTSIKETARQLKVSEERLNRAQRIAHLGSWELDIASNVLTWSDEVFRIFGLQPQSFAPCYEDFLDSVHPEDREKVHTIYWDSLRKGKDYYEIEHRIVQKSTGTIRYVHEKCEHFRDENGKLIRSGGMVHDITERNEADKKILILNNELQRNIRQLAESNKELERSNRDLQQYAYIISHDLQEPLRTVSSFVQLLSRRYQGKLDEKADTFINFAVEGAAHMQKLLTDLLLFSRVGGGELRLGKVSLGAVLDSILCHLKNAIEESGARIESESLPVVLADEMQLTNLLQNLISNALKFRSEQPPQIHVSAKREGSEWIICVRDNGIGIDPKFADRIFMVFQRLHRRDEYPGTGIGLAICKKVVERSGGRIWVESEPGRGAAFYFSLPAGEG